MTELTDIFKYDFSKGVFIPDFSAIHDECKSQVKSALEISNDIQPETPLGRLTEFFARMYFECLKMNARIANQFNIEYATGIYLDSIGTFFDIHRNAETYTTVRATLFGLAGTDVPSGLLVRDEETRKLYTSQGSVTLGDNGTADVTFVCREPGPINCNENKLNIIESGVIGLFEVRSNRPGIPGNLLESDYSLRQRIKNGRVNSKAIIPSFISNLYSLDGVKSVCVLQNNLTESYEKRGVILPPNSVFICIDGGDNQQIAECIWGNLPACSALAEGASLGDTTRELSPITVNVIEKYSGQSYPITFFPPIEASLTVELKIYNQAITDETKSVIRDTIVDYINGIGVGGKLQKFRLISLLHDNTKTVDLMISEVNIEQGDELLRDTYQFLGFEKPIIANRDLDIIIGEIPEN